jgi:hypothetical protein
MSAQIIAFPRPRRTTREQERQKRIDELVTMFSKHAKTPEQKKRARADTVKFVEELEEAGREISRRQRRGEVLDNAALLDIASRMTSLQNPPRKARPTRHRGQAKPPPR